MNSPLERRSFTEIFNNENNAPKKKAKKLSLFTQILVRFKVCLHKFRKFGNFRQEKIPRFFIFFLERKFETHRLLF